jgi:ABC-type spermidine/putrescine transport system permease subunit II
MSRLRRIRRGFSWLWIYVPLLFAFIFAPLVLVVLFSFNGSPSLTFPFTGPSLRWYREIFGDAAFRQSVINSLEVAVVVVIAVLIVGTLASYATARYRFRGSTLTAGLIMAPAALPGLFVGISLLTVYAEAGVQLSLTTVVFAHVLYTLPYFFLVTNSRLQRFDPLLEETARDLGANTWVAFRKVTFPIIAPTLFAASLLVFALSWDEFLITFFVIGNQNTLPLEVWGKVRYSVDPSVNAISTLLLVGSISFIFLVKRLIADLSQPN